MYQVWIHPGLQVNNSFCTSKHPSYVPSYVPIVNPSRETSERQVGDIKVERRTTLEKGKALENIFA